MATITTERSITNRVQTTHPLARIFNRLAYISNPLSIYLMDYHRFSLVENFKRLRSRIQHTLPSIKDRGVNKIVGMVDLPDGNIGSLFYNHGSGMVDVICACPLDRENTIRLEKSLKFMGGLPFPAAGRRIDLTHEILARSSSFTELVLSETGGVINLIVNIDGNPLTIPDEPSLQFINKEMERCNQEKPPYSFSYQIPTGKLTAFGLTREELTPSVAAVSQALGFVNNFVDLIGSVRS